MENGCPPSRHPALTWSGSRYNTIEEAAIAPMKHHKADGQHSFIETVKARQRNVVWPDPLRNSRAVDVFLWRGSAKPPLVQRIGARLIGGVYVLGGLGFVGFAREWHSRYLVLLALAYILVGIRVFRNGFGRHKP